jgi:hypothetical protein
MDLFVVVVGVDPRWLLRSLHQSYAGVLSKPTDDERDDYWQSTPRNYLEKIFQIPFVLPAMTPDGFIALMTGYGQPGPGTDGHGHHQPAPEPAGQAAPAGADQAGTKIALPPIAVDQGSVVEQVTSGKAVEYVQLTEREIEFLGRLAPMVRTPRAAKRMVNIYQMLRTTTFLGSASDFLGSGNRPGEHQAAAQLVGILTAFPELFGQMCWGSADQPAGDPRGAARPLMRMDPAASWPTFVNGLDPIRQPADAWRNNVVERIDDGAVESWRKLVATFRVLLPEVGVVALVPYQRWAPQIGRFSFVLSPYAGNAVTPG